jgi:hypothetical protein
LAEIGLQFFIAFLICILLHDPLFFPLKFGLQSNLICLLVLCSTGKRGRGDLDLLDGDSRFLFCFCLAEQAGFLSFLFLSRFDWEKPGGDKDRVGTKPVETKPGQRWDKGRSRRGSILLVKKSD